MSPTILENSLNYDDLVSVIRKVSAEHSPPLDQIVCLTKYARKIKLFGNTIELWDGETLCGFCCAYFNDTVTKCAYVSLIHVICDFRRKGMGSLLLKAVLKKALLSGLHTISLRVNKSNTVAISFYKKNGFSIKAEEKTQYLLNLTIQGC